MGLKQRGFRFIGLMKHMLQHTAFWVSMLNFGMLAVTAYSTTLRAHILTVMPDFKLWHFLLILTGLVLLAMLVEYLVIYPSWVKFQNEQEYRHENLLRRDIVQLRAMVTDIGYFLVGQTDMTAEKLAETLTELAAAAKEIDESLTGAGLPTEDSRG